MAKKFALPMNEEWGDEEEMMNEEEPFADTGEETEYPNGEVHAARCSCKRCTAQAEDAQSSCKGKPKSLAVVIAMGEKKMDNAKTKMARKFGKGVVRGVNLK